MRLADLHLPRGLGAAPYPWDWLFVLRRAPAPGFAAPGSDGEPAAEEGAEEGAEGGGCGGGRGAGGWRV